MLELLEVVQFRSPDTMMKLSPVVSNTKYELLVIFCSIIDCIFEHICKLIC